MLTLWTSARSEKGSPLKNVFARNSGKRSIVFLDEFEKTTPSIYQAMLLPFDNGKSSSLGRSCEFLSTYRLTPKQERAKIVGTKSRWIVSGYLHSRH